MGAEQIFLALFGAGAIFLSQDPRESHRKWAPILGLLGQPFWFYSAWQGQQWGVFFLCVLYAIAWARGFYAYWINPRIV